MINRFSHWLSHLFRNEEGKVVTWREGDKIFVGFECSTCKVIDPKSIMCCNVKPESEIINE